MFKSLREIAPSKYISLDTLVEMFEPPAYLPDIWSHVTKQQVTTMLPWELPGYHGKQHVTLCKKKQEAGYIVLRIERHPIRNSQKEN